jgi:hypothetical protein
MKNEQGTVLLFTVLVIGLASVSAFLTLSRAGIGVFLETQQQEVAILDKQILYGCLDELLFQRSLDSTYTATTIDILDGQCTASMTEIGAGVLHADILYIGGESTKSLYVELSSDPVVVTFIEER